MMLMNQTPDKTDHIDILIEQYQKETHRDSRKRDVYFPGLFSALNASPTPEQTRLIGNEAANMIVAKDAFSLKT